jgi:hypothetical protein
MYNISNISSRKELLFSLTKALPVYFLFESRLTLWLKRGCSSEVLWSAIKVCPSPLDSCDGYIKCMAEMNMKVVTEIKNGGSFCRRYGVSKLVLSISLHISR